MSMSVACSVADVKSGNPLSAFSNATVKYSAWVVATFSNSSALRERGPMHNGGM